MEDFGASAGREVFALTDEQILGMEPEGLNGEESGNPAGARDGGEGVAEGRSEVRPLQEAPGWLVREMKDPWVGDEARELWEGVQRAKREAAEFREVIGSPEDARALKEIYPGGVAEAKSAAERARELAEIDAAIFGAPGRPAEMLRTGRVQLVERLYAQDPAAFREMVEAGVRLLGGAENERKVESGEWRVTSGREEKPAASTTEDAAPSQGSVSGVDSGARAGVPVPQERVQGYREFERAANAELERSVGGAIRRAMETALPNLRSAGGAADGREGQAAPLQERLRVAVREEVEAALRSDTGLGEQVARILSGKRFDEGARAQVVRLIDARAQQLVPGAVKKVVGSWTAATLGASKAGVSGEERKSVASARAASEARTTVRNERANPGEAGRKLARGRVDYRKWSDEQILEM